MTNDHNPAALNIGEIKSALTRRSFLRNVAVTGIAAASAAGMPDMLRAQGQAAGSHDVGPAYFHTGLIVGDAASSL